MNTDDCLGLSYISILGFGTVFRTLGFTFAILFIPSNSDIITSFFTSAASRRPLSLNISFPSALKKLQELLGVNYTRWDRFKAKVLDSCQQALKETTDIYYTYERGKTGTGGKWLTIIFYISKNNDYVDQLSLFEFMGQSEEQSGSAKEPQLELFDNETEQNESTAFFSGACDDEFTATEIESLVTIVNTMELPPHEMGSVFAKYHFLLEQYTRFKAISERTTIKNRYSYFYTMIQSERDKQRGEQP